MNNTLRTVFKHIAYISALLLLMYILGVKHGLLMFAALMMFGWGMNLENHV